jgi:hypothetical protein
MGALSRKFTVYVIYSNVIYISLVGLHDQLCGTPGLPPTKKIQSHEKFPVVQEGLSFFCGMFSINVS